jgi:hypothetical protein
MYPGLPIDQARMTGSQLTVIASITRRWSRHRPRRLGIRSGNNG